MIVRSRGRDLHNPYDWEAELLDLRVGDAVPLIVRRGGQEFTETVQVADLPEVNAPKVEVLKELQLVTLTPAIRAERNVRSTHGAVIYSVTPRVSDELGIRAGDVIVQVNRTPVAIRRPGGRGAELLRRARAHPHVLRAQRPGLHDGLQHPMSAPAPTARHRRSVTRATPLRWPSATRRRRCWRCGRPQTRHGLWRRIWLALAEAERELGADVPAIRDRRDAGAPRRHRLPGRGRVRAAFSARRDGARARVRRRGAGGAPRDPSRRDERRHHRQRGPDPDAHRARDPAPSHRAGPARRWRRSPGDGARSRRSDTRICSRRS